MPVEVSRKIQPYFDPAVGCHRLPLQFGKSVLIDSADAATASRFMWGSHQRPDGSVCVYGRALDPDGVCRSQAKISLGRVLISASADERVMLLNDDEFDYRRSNLRLGSQFDSRRHEKKKRTWNGEPCTSRFKGVHFDRSRGRWKATIRVDGRQRTLGRFDDERRAAEVYDEAAMTHFGEFARLNFPQGGQPR